MTPITAQVDYLKIIEKYIPPSSMAFRIYMVHVSLVTAKALKIGRRLKLDSNQLRFIEEACMLHDIGIVKIRKKIIGCTGELPYIFHLPEGRKILEQEGLPMHARVAENHVGVGGLTKDEIIRKKLLIPPVDMLAETIEEKIISYADLFYSKNPSKLWVEKSHKLVRSKAILMGKRQERLFEKWIFDFEGIRF